MQSLVDLYNRLHDVILDGTRGLSFLGPLALRLYLVPVFWIAGRNKMNGFDNVVEWFGNPDWGLGLPMPTLMAAMATGTEVIGAVLLLLGLAVRWISIPLMITMLVAVFTVHWHNGWQAVHDLQSFGVTERTGEAVQRLSSAKDILKEHGNYDWLTQMGNFVISNSGIEWAVTYFVMLLALFFTGAGGLSLDNLLSRMFRSDRQA